MKTINKQYLDITKTHPNWNKMKLHTYYELGGMNYFTYKVEDRGIYLSVTPVMRTEDSEITTAFTGTKFLVKPLKRWSKSCENFKVDYNTLMGCITYVANSNQINMSSIDTKTLQNE